jgi:hypothetical protein
MSSCWACMRGQHDGCLAYIIDAECDCTHETTAMPAAVGVFGGLLADVETEYTNLNLGLEEPDSKTVTRRYKNDDAVTDQQSTGRKRAAKLYPLTDANGNKKPCDFANKSAVLPKYMEVQIDGCGVRPHTMPNPAQSRHHHDYNTLNNERENVGLLCHSCHNLLHARNDPFKATIYERIYGVKPNVDDLRHANKALKSGVVAGGHIANKE